MKLYKNILINLLIVVSSILFVYGIDKYSLQFESVEKNHNKETVKKEVDISEVIESIAKNKTIISKNNISNEFISVVTIDETSKHTTYIIDTNSKKSVDFENIIKSNKLEDFWIKVFELLDLKYPKFIVNALKNNTGTKYYEIKNNEMIIYFEDYVIDPVYEEIISVKVNYNEVNDYLNFDYNLDNEYVNESGYDYDKNKKTIALTFDDGPSGKNTIEIVDALKDNKMRGTFFMVGNKMNNYKESIIYTSQNGNEIGSHTFSHINMKKKKIDVIINELEITNNLYNSITGDNLTLVRPPYGAYNEEILLNINQPFVTWNIDTNDWRYHDVEYLINHIMTNATDGSIILMHESYATSVETVKKVLPLLYCAGFQVVSVSELASFKGVNLEPNQVYSYLK